MANYDNRLSQEILDLLSIFSAVKLESNRFGLVSNVTHLDHECLNHGVARQAPLKPSLGYTGQRLYLLPDVGLVVHGYSPLTRRAKRIPQNDEPAALVRSAPARNVVLVRNVNSRHVISLLKPRDSKLQIESILG